MFFNRQIFVKREPGVKVELSGTVTSRTSSIRSHPRFGVGVRVWKGVCVGVVVGAREGVSDGVTLGVGVLVGVKVSVGV